MSAVVKRRLVKLVVNFLFYFRTDEAEVGRRGGGSRAGVWGARVARPSASSAPSPSEPCCWNTAESPRKSPPDSPSVSVGGDPQLRPIPPQEQSPLSRAGLLPYGAGCAHLSQPRPSRSPPPLRTYSSPLGIPDLSVCSAVLSPVLSARLCASNAGGFSWVAWRGSDLQGKQEL